MGKLVSLLLERHEEESLDEAFEAQLRHNLSVFEGLLRAFGAAGFDDVVAVVVDGRPAYVDTEETIGDLQLALEGVVRTGAVADGFSVLRTTFCRRDDGLKVLAELRCHARGEQRTEQIRVRISARPQTFDPADDEGPREYAGRVREYLRDATLRARHVEAVQGIVEGLAGQIPRALGGATISVQPTVIRFISPGARQLGRLRHLGFGQQRKRTVYCSLPAYERIGPYDDPLSLHYYSPYHDLFHWIAVGEVLGGQVPDELVEVVSATGSLLFRGDTAASFDPSSLDPARNVVRVSPEGHLKIDPSVPEVARLDLAPIGTPHSPGWGGEQWADDISE